MEIYANTRQLVYVDELDVLEKLLDKHCPHYPQASVEEKDGNYYITDIGGSHGYGSYHLEITKDRFDLVNHLTGIIPILKRMKENGKR